MNKTAVRLAILVASLSTAISTQAKSNAGKEFIPAADKAVHTQKKRSVATQSQTRNQASSPNSSKAIVGKPPVHSQASSIGHWLVGAGVGLNVIHLSPKSQTITPVNQSDYVLGDQSQSTAIEAFRVGYQWPMHLNWMQYIALFLEYDHVNQEKFSGTVTQPPITTPSAFEFQVDHDSLFLLGQATFPSWHRFAPFVQLGLGFSRNEFVNYSDNMGTSQELANRNHSTFAYLVGLGVDWQVAAQWTLGATYRFVDHDVVSSGNSAQSGAVPASLKYDANGHQLLLSATMTFN